MFYLGLLNNLIDDLENSPSYAFIKNVPLHVSDITICIACHYMCTVNICLLYCTLVLDTFTKTKMFQKCVFWLF